MGALLASVFAGSSAAAPGDTIVTVSQVADINMGSGDSDPALFEVIGSTAFFEANDGTNGTELWKSEPPYSSATMVDNINTESGGSSNPAFLTNVNGTLFFAAQTGTSTGSDTGRELYKSEPPYNAASTNLVADIFPGDDESSNPSELFNFDGTLLFSARSDANTGTELWRSTGGPLAPGGTELVEDIEPTAGVSSFPYGFAKLNATTVLFGATTNADQNELWRTDGTGGAGTAQVDDINPSGSSDPVGLIAAGSNVFFRAEGETGVDIELYKSDGTMAEEIDVNDTSVGASSNPTTLADVNGTLFFSATDGVNGIELWKSDGGDVGSGTEMVADINPGPSDSGPSDPARLNGTLFFRADDSAAVVDHGIELWRSDGTTTNLVADIRPGDNSSSPVFLTNVNGTIFFRANDGMFGDELWRSGGTAATTVRTSDIFPGVSSSSPNNLTDVNGTLLFSANDDGTTGRELWKAVLSTEPFPPTVPPTTTLPVTPAATPQKKCKKGRKLKKGKCVKKKRKRK